MVDGNINIPSAVDLSSGSRRSPQYIKKQFPEFYEYLMSTQRSSEQRFPELLYLYYYGEPSACPVCGNRPQFISFSKGFSKFCSPKCANSDPSKKDKARKTCEERYGGTGFASKELMNKCKKVWIEHYGSLENLRYIQREKRRQTCLDMYGTEWGLCSPVIREKIKQTCLERYGVENVFRVPELYKKARNAFEEKYGYDNPSKVPEIIEKLKQNNLEKFGVEYPFQSPDIQRKCYYHDTKIEQFVQNILDKQYIKYIREDQNLIPNGRIDFTLPDHKIAIEVNGSYWHSDIFRESSYHKNRFEAVRKLGWQLLTVWEDQIIRCPKIIESVILSKLGIYENRIYARLCTISSITSKQANTFLEQNHIQGKTSSTIKLGAFYDGELIGVMTFIQSRGCQGSSKTIEGQWELNRFCTVMGLQVIGLVSKMVSYFIKHHNPKSIISFSHNDISTGNVYKLLGFEATGKTNSSYYYIKNNKRYHRSNFTRSAISNKWPEYDINDKSWTERSVMKAKRYQCIYDCGTQKWVKNFENL